MNKLEKSKNLEAARVLLISARDMAKTAILKIRETGPSGISCLSPDDEIHKAIILVIHMQNKLEGK